MNNPPPPAQRVSPSNGHSRNDPFVFVVIVTWNGSEFLKECLPSLAATEYRNYRVLLVDNGSHDGAAKCAQSLLPDIEILRNEENIGFAAGNNRGIARALDCRADYIVLLNDDTVVLNREWLSSAVACAEDNSEVGMIGFAITARKSAPTQAEEDSPQSTSHIPGCALFVRSEVFREIGVFDEVYFNYYEEDDLEARTQRAGYTLVQINPAIYHRSGGTSAKVPRRTQYYSIRNSIRCSLKNRSVAKTLLRCLRLLEICCSPQPASMLSNDEAHLRARGSGNLLANLAVYCAALGWNILHLWATMRSRKVDDRRISEARLARRGPERAA